MKSKPTDIAFQGLVIFLLGLSWCLTNGVNTESHARYKEDSLLYVWFAVSPVLLGSVFLVSVHASILLLNKILSSVRTLMPAIATAVVALWFAAPLLVDFVMILMHPVVRTL
ncbi:MAG: hypothetical protein ACAI34_05620 [Verrucomicrobium sp.]